MQSATDVTRPFRTSGDEENMTFWSIGACRELGMEPDGHAVDGIAPAGIGAGERIRNLPGAVLLAAGYFASRVPAVKTLIRRLD
jgi:hypothetical protein